MSTTIIAPVDLSAATKTGPRMFRKQILRKGVIRYPVPGKPGKTRRIAFDDGFVADLAQSYRDGAYDNVPFVLADEKNRHTMDPTRFAGWIKGVEVTPDGLDALIELSAEAAELIERTGGKLGVSPRIRPVEHVDGRRFNVAINHVLGTLDARQQGPTFGLRDWEPIDLSTDPTDTVLDLSGAVYQEGSTMPHIIDLSQLDDAAAEALVSFAAANDIDLSEAEVDDAGDDAGEGSEEGQEGTDDEGGDEGSGEGEGDEDVEISDEELDALIEAELANIGVELSASDEDAGDDDLDLAAGLAGTAGEEAIAARSENASLRFQIAAREYRDAGVPPHIIDLAQPVLSLSDDELDTIDLSSPATGEPIDVRGIVSGMLDAMKGTIDLSSESGHGNDDGEDGKAEDETAERWIDFLENN